MRSYCAYMACCCLVLLCVRALCSIERSWSLFSIVGVVFNDVRLAIRRELCGSEYRAILTV